MKRYGTPQLVICAAWAVLVSVAAARGADASGRDLPPTPVAPPVTSTLTTLPSPAAPPNQSAASPASAYTNAQALSASTTGPRPSRQWRIVQAARPNRSAVAITPFVQACGTSLCLNGTTWQLYGATIYAGYDDPAGRIALAKSAGLNTLRLVNFIDPADTMADLAVVKNWIRLDLIIADAHASGLRVILDLSDYRNLLVKAGRNPYTTDWGPFLQTVADRINTVSGLRYRDDPTIALVSFSGEVEPIKSPKNVLGVTTGEVTDFFRRTFAEWRSFDPNHLMSTGGLGQLDWPSGVDWRSIMALPGSDVCSIIAYGDSTTSTIPSEVESYCGTLGRPWITEEFGTPIKIGDASRAKWYGHVIQENRDHNSAGTAFWNLGPQTIPDSFDVNPQSPILWAAVVSDAPGSPPRAATSPS